MTKNFDDTQYTGNPLFNTEEDEGSEGQMETYSPHVDRVLEQDKINPKTVWTIIDGDDDRSYIVAGYHYVNRFMHFITNEEWTSESEEYVWGI